MKNFVKLVAVSALLAGCGGGGGESPLPASGPSPSPAPTPTPTLSPAPAPTTVPIAGKITFDFVPASRFIGLDYVNSVRRPARSVSVALIDSATGAELATAKTNSSGNYSLVGPVGKSVFVRAYARLLPVNTSTTEVISVLDNTNTDAQWAMVGTTFSAVDATALTKDLNAGSGWTGTAYNDSQRIAGPFAMLDTVYTAMQKIVAVDANASFQKLIIHWSPNNVAAAGSLSLGQIGTSFFTGTTSGSTVTSRDLYILGKANNDTDEYDGPVIAHEFGHYLQSVFSRDDSTGGSHGGSNDILDMRVAFSEGWGNGWSAYALDNKYYVDTKGTAQASAFFFDVSLGASTNPGWFKEDSVQRIIWDLSTGSIGFGPVWTAFKTLASVPALTSAHSFANVLRLNLPSSLLALNSTFNNQQIAVPSDAYGIGETNFGAPPIDQIQPIYYNYGSIGSTLNVCVSNAADTGGAGNKAGEHRYVKLVLPLGVRTFTVARDSATALAGIATDPDFTVYSVTGRALSAAGTTANTDSATADLAAGNYVFVLTDYTFKTSIAKRRPCFNILVN